MLLNVIFIFMVYVCNFTYCENKHRAVGCMVICCILQFNNTDMDIKTISSRLLKLFMYKLLSALVIICTYVVSWFEVPLEADVCFPQLKQTRLITHETGLHFFYR